MACREGCLAEHRSASGKVEDSHGPFLIGAVVGNRWGQCRFLMSYARAGIHEAGQQEAGILSFRHRARGTAGG